MQNPATGTDELRNIEKIVAAIEHETKSTCSGLVTYPSRHWRDLGGSVALSYTRISSLRKSVDSTFSQTLTGNARTAVRKAISSGVRIRPISPAEIEQGHLLLCKTQERVGASYTTNPVFFEELCKSPSTRAHVAEFEEQIIGVGLLLLGFGQGFHFLHGWNREYASLSANQLLIWRMIEDTVACGASLFNMGESHSPDLDKAKSRWGSEPVPILKLT